MTKFAKLFESEKYGQILARKTTDEDGAPYLAVTFVPSFEIFPNCSEATSGFTYNDDDNGWSELDRAFDEFDLEMGEAVVESVTKSFNKNGAE